MFVISRNFREKSRLPQTHPFQPTITMPKRSPLTPISANKTPRRELSTFTKGQISGLARSGLARAGLIPTEIHHQLNVPRTTIQRFLQREQTVPSGENRSRCDRPPVVTPRAVRSVLRYVRINPKTSWNQVKTALGLKICRQTFNKVLKNNGIAHWIALRRPKLTPALANLRLNWARKHEDWTVEQWKTVI